MKLNLGCGYDRRDGFVNADSFPQCEPDVLMDIEEVPWPFETGQFEYVLMKHVLEHVGQTPRQFLDVLAELYRVCRHDARVEIHVPHPLHQTFMADPTHLRPIMPLTLRMLSKKQNLEWVAARANYTMLALAAGVDFELEKAIWVADSAWSQRKVNEGHPDDWLGRMAQLHPGVIKELQYVVRVVKEDEPRDA